MSTRLRFWCALGLALVPVGLLAPRAISQNAARVPSAPPNAGTPAKPGKAANPNNGSVNIKNSPQGTSTWDDNQGLARITKDVVMWQTGEDLILYAQDVSYSKPLNKAVATGKLRVETRDSTIRADKLMGNFDNRTLQMAGNVVVTTHGKKDGINGSKDSDASRPIKITCDTLDWDYETKQAVLSGNLHIYQGTSIGTCKTIEYDEPSNVAVLKGGVRFGDEKQRIFLSEELTVFGNSGKIQSDQARIFIPKEGQGTEDSSTPTSPRPSRTPKPVATPRNLTPDMFDGTGITPPTKTTPTTSPAPALPAPPDDVPADESPARPDDADATGN